MPLVKLSPVFNSQTFIPGTNTPASGYKLFVYAAGSSTKLASYTDSTGTVQQANPIILNSGGLPANPIWLASGLSYKLVLAPSTDTDPPASAVLTFDGITGVNDASSTTSQWQASGVTPTFVSTTSFTVPGDQTNEFHVRRRAQFTVSAGTVYGSIVSSSFSAPNTTVTMSMDVGTVLDSGLTSVNLSIIRADKDALPAITGARVAGLTGNVNAGTPLSKYDIAADSVTLRNPGGSSLVRYNTGTLTCDLGLAGPAANGRDQAGAFAASNWIYLYFIWNGSTIATLASLTAPASFTGSTLPTGYTHWAFATAIRWSGSSSIVDSYARGNRQYYKLKQSALVAGTATVFTSVSLSSFVPPNALTSMLWAVYFNATGGIASYVARIGVVSGNTYTDLQFGVETAGGPGRDTQAFDAPNVSQSIVYAVDAASTALSIDVRGYTVPNGGE